VVVVHGLVCWGAVALLVQAPLPRRLLLRAQPVLLLLFGVLLLAFGALALLRAVTG
jgi:threonine/homoserine/homoserine lactone efflux protein